MKKIIKISTTILCLSLMSFKLFTSSDLRQYLTGTISKGWALKHSLVNGYEGNVKSRFCPEKQLRLKFTSEGFVLQDTSCVPNSPYVMPIQFELVNDSLFFAGMNYKIENITEDKLVLSQTHPTTVYNENNIPTDTVSATFQLLFEIE